MDTNKPKLKVGILTDTLLVPAYQETMLRRIQLSAYASITIVLLGDDPQPKQAGWVQRAWRSRHSLVYKLYSKIDKACFTPKRDAFHLVDIQPLLEDVTIERVKFCRKGSTDRVETNDISYLREQEVDVFVNLNSRGIDGSILDSANYGVWRFQHGDHISLRNGPPGFWEIFEGFGTVGTVLQIRSRGEFNRYILGRTCAATDNISVTRNLNLLYWNSLSILPRELEQLYNLGERAYFARQQKSNRVPDFSGSEIRGMPKNLECLVMMFKLSIRLIRLKVYALFMNEQWLLLYRKSEKLDGVFYRYKMILPPKDRFWADPFPVVDNEKSYIFFEEALYSQNRAHLSVMQLFDDGSYSDPVRILEKPYHLSYPFIFRWNERYYMIPESSQNRTIDLYVCDDFPYRWRLECTLMKDVNAVDTTLVNHDGRWWLFANIVENEGASNSGELFLFFADSPVTDKWTAHPLNPVISDARQARPAGSCFAHNGLLIRPSQESSRTLSSRISSSAYGNKLVFNQIVTMTKKDYREKRLSTVAPNWNRRLVAIHTFNRAGNLNTADAKLWRWRWW